MVSIYYDTEIDTTSYMDHSGRQTNSRMTLGGEYRMWEWKSIQRNTDKSRSSKNEKNVKSNINL